MNNVIHNVNISLDTYNTILYNTRMDSKKPKRHFLIAEVDRVEKREVKRFARRQKKSVGDVVRNAVRNEIAQLKREQAA